MVRVSEDFNGFMVDLLFIFIDKFYVLKISHFSGNFLRPGNITVLSRYYHTFITLPQTLRFYDIYFLYPSKNLHFARKKTVEYLNKVKEQ